MLLLHASSAESGTEGPININKEVVEDMWYMAGRSAYETRDMVNGLETGKETDI